jgi:hypothetical protein
MMYNFIQRTVPRANASAFPHPAGRDLLPSSLRLCVSARDYLCLVAAVFSLADQTYRKSHRKSRGGERAANSHADRFWLRHSPSTPPNPPRSNSGPK